MLWQLNDYVSLAQKVTTVFDSTGVAIEDIAVARLIYTKAKEEGGYPSITLVEG